MFRRLKITRDNAEDFMRESFYESPYVWQGDRKGRYYIYHAECEEWFPPVAVFKPSGTEYHMFLNPKFGTETDRSLIGLHMNLGRKRLMGKIKS